MLVHDIIKIRYAKSGYLPDWPPHLISDEEMLHAFLNDDEDDVCYFDETYPNPGEGLSEAYENLRNNIRELLDAFLENGADIPDWVYSYMLGAVVGPNSETQDIHDLLVLLNKDSIYDLFTPEISGECFKVSEAWVKRYTTSRAPSVFGEPHVIKSLRLQLANPMGR